MQRMEIMDAIARLHARLVELNLELDTCSQWVRVDGEQMRIADDVGGVIDALKFKLQREGL